MKETKNVYGHFDILHRNKDQQLTKVTYSSLDKYNQSPYLQSTSISHAEVVQSTQKKSSHRSITPSKRKEGLAEEKKVETITRNQLPKLTPSIKYKEGQIINYFQAESEIIHNHLGQLKNSIGSHSATLEVNTTKKAKLEPIQKGHKIHYSIKTKAGTTGRQAKINQDIAIAQVRFPFGIKLFCVCDGHGLNGHLVSAYIKSHLLKNLNGSLNKLNKLPSLQEVRDIVHAELLKTNKQLLQSDINTELSGSTVVAIVIFGNKILSFNIGDSRAIIIKQTPLDSVKDEKSETGSKEEIKKKDISDGFRFNKASNCKWSVVELSIDQKPERADEHQRVIKNGGRIFSQKNQQGQDLGPLRVWMKDVMMPGLAMTRSFGDKAGLKAGTTGEPEILEFDLTEEDKCMIVASDGIWEYLQNEEVMNLVIPYYLKDDLEMAGQRLVRISTQIWHKISLSRDDITAMIVSLNAPSK